MIRSDEVYWESALDLNRVILGGQIVALLALLVLRSDQARPPVTAAVPVVCPAKAPYRALRAGRCAPPRRVWAS